MSLSASPNLFASPRRPVLRLVPSPAVLVHHGLNKAWVSPTTPEELALIVTSTMKIYLLIRYVFCKLGYRNLFSVESLHLD